MEWPCGHFPQSCRPRERKVSLRTHGSDYAWSREECVASGDWCCCWGQSRLAPIYSYLKAYIVSSQAVRLFPVRRSVCPGAVCASATKKFIWILEVRVSLGYLDLCRCTLLSRVEYRPLEGFVLGVSPFNFTAIGGNIPGGMLFLPIKEALYELMIPFSACTRR